MIEWTAQGMKWYQSLDFRYVDLLLPDRSYFCCSIAPSCHMFWDVNYWAPHIVCQAAAETHHTFNVSITLNYTEELHSTHISRQMSLIHLQWKELWSYEIKSCWICSPTPTVLQRMIMSFCHSHKIPCRHVACDSPWSSQKETSYTNTTPLIQIHFSHPHVISNLYGVDCAL